MALIAPALTGQTRQGEIRRARRPVANEFIVTLNASADPDAMGLETAAIRGGRLRHVYRDSLRGFAIRLSNAQAQQLAEDPRVASVEEDGLLQADLTESPAPWGLDRIDQRALPLDGRYSYGPMVRSVRVHVLDTGIRETHAEFEGRAFNIADYIGDGRNGVDCNGHGTHVAATIGGATYGVAKHVTLFSYRVLDCNGDGTVSGAIAAVDRVTADPYRPAVANMSLGSGVSDALDAAVRRSIASGITYVVAAGNDAVDALNQSPARVSEAITVGATGTNDARATFSNFGSRVDLFAPGVSIPSAWFTGDTAAASMSGTSMATPHVSGVAALYLEQLPDALPATVHGAIVGGATPGVVINAGPNSPTSLLYSSIASAATASPADLTGRDIGTPGATGRVTFSSGSYTIEGAGADIWGTADAFQFAYRPLEGDGAVTARVTSVEAVHAWTKAALMIRASTAADAANAALLVSAGKGLSFQRRATNGGTTITTLAPGVAPIWLRLSRLGNVFTASRSADGVAWTVIDRATITMPRDVLIGLAVSSHVQGKLASANFTGVSFGLPGDRIGNTAYFSSDIGNVGAIGSAAEAAGSFSLAGAGADVWGTADAFRYAYQRISGDFDAETVVRRLDAVHAWTKAGVMIRESLQPGSAHAFALLSAGKGAALQYRATNGGLSAQAGIIPGVAPLRLRLSRRGSQISASARAEGSTTWQPLGTITITMGPSVYLGMAVTSHDATRAANAGFDFIAVNTP